MLLPGKQLKHSTRSQLDRDSTMARLMDPSRLPTPLALAMQIVRTCANPDADSGEIVKLLNRDPALCAKLLRTVNSCLYGLPQPVSSPERAVMILGLTRLRSLVLSLTLPAMPMAGLTDADQRDYWLSSVTGAIIAREIARHVEFLNPEDDLVAGLLRDIGMPLMQSAFPLEWQRVVSLQKGSFFEDRGDAEREVFGLSHGEVSAELLKAWKLPEELVEPIRYHDSRTLPITLSRTASMRAELLQFTEFVANLDVIVDESHTLARVLQLARDRYRLPESELIRLLHQVVPKVDEFIRILDIDAGQSSEYARTITAGCNELARLAVRNDSLETGTPPALDSSGKISKTIDMTAWKGKLEIRRIPFSPSHCNRLPEGGCQLDTYEVRSILGRGGMGVVFRAFDPTLEREVAIKTLLPNLEIPLAQERFMREARTAAAIRHDNVITIYAVGETGPTCFLVMEYVAGRSLQEVLETGIPIPLATLLAYTRQILAGLAAAHERNIVHRDIKPANILLEDSSQRIKITDFGLARGEDDIALSREGAIIGTPMYMSPEQIRGQPASKVSDIYCLGSMLYVLSTGKSYLRSNNMAALVEGICNQEPTPPRQLRPDLPRWFDAVIMKMMRKAPDNRFQSANEALQILIEASSDAAQPRSSQFWKRWWRS